MEQEEANRQAAKILHDYKYAAITLVDSEESFLNILRDIEVITPQPHEQLYVCPICGQKKVVVVTTRDLGGEGTSYYYCKECDSEVDPPLDPKDQDAVQAERCCATCMFGHYDPDNMGNYHFCGIKSAGLIRSWYEIDDIHRSRQDCALWERRD